MMATGVSPICKWEEWQRRWLEGWRPCTWPLPQINCHFLHVLEQWLWVTSDPWMTFHGMVCWEIAMTLFFCMPMKGCETQCGQVSACEEQMSWEVRWKYMQTMNLTLASVKSMRHRRKWPIYKGLVHAVRSSGPLPASVTEVTHASNSSEYHFYSTWKNIIMPII